MKLATLIALFHGRCLWCGDLVTLQARRDHPKAPTREHLQPASQGGRAAPTWRWRIGAATEPAAGGSQPRPALTRYECRLCPQVMLRPWLGFWSCMAARSGFAVLGLACARTP
jgi:hypothetical protein